MSQEQDLTGQTPVALHVAGTDLSNTDAEQVHGERAVAWLRAVLLAGWAAIAVTALTVGQFSTSLADLKAAVAAGQVREVTSLGAMEPGVTGYGVQEVTWRQDWWTRRTEVRVLTPGEQPPTSDLPVVGRDVLPQLRQLNPDLVVREGQWSQSSSSIWGVRMPPWVGLTWLLLALTTLGLVMSGPQPWRASRWAWFWLGWLPGGQVAFLVLSGPTPPLTRPGPRAWRLTGGWAFLALLVITAAT